MKRAISLTLLFISTVTYSGIETDKSVGNCVAYFAASQKERGARTALSLADNQARAMKYAEMRMDEFQKYKSNKSLLEGSIYSAASDCREIGLRPSEY